MKTGLRLGARMLALGLGFAAFGVGGGGEGGGGNDCKYHLLL